MNATSPYYVLKSYIQGYTVATIAIRNGVKYRTIILKRIREIDDYLDGKILERLDGTSEISSNLYTAMNCHNAFILSIQNRNMIKD